VKNKEREGEIEGGREKKKRGKRMMKYIKNDLKLYICIQIFMYVCIIIYLYFMYPLTYQVHKGLFTSIFPVILYRFPLYGFVVASSYITLIDYNGLLL